MSYPTLRAGTANSLPYPESTRLLHGSSRRSEALLLAETALVAAAAVLAIKAVAWGPLSRAIWLLAPAVLVVSALLPTAARKAAFPRILPADVTRLERALAVLFKTCAAVLPATLAALWLLRYAGLQPPLRPATPRSGQWFAWLFYQFMYVAVAEEVFFRGFLYSAFKKNWGVFPALFLSSLLFSLVHLEVYSFIPLFIIQGIIYIDSCSLQFLLFHDLSCIDK